MLITAFAYLYPSRGSLSGRRTGYGVSGRNRTSDMTIGTAGISSRFAYSIRLLYQLSYTNIEAGQA